MSPFVDILSHPLIRIRNPGIHCRHMVQQVPFNVLDKRRWQREQRKISNFSNKFREIRLDDRFHDEPILSRNSDTFNINLSLLSTVLNTKEMLSMMKSTTTGSPKLGTTIFSNFIILAKNTPSTLPFPPLRFFLFNFGLKSSFFRACFLTEIKATMKPMIAIPPAYKVNFSVLYFSRVRLDHLLQGQADHAYVALL